VSSTDPAVEVAMHGRDGHATHGNASIQKVPPTDWALIAIIQKVPPTDCAPIAHF
jgi:hypothetical protein